MAGRLTNQEAELVECLIEEASEVIKAVTKALRHGWFPSMDGVDYNNARDLSVELGQMQY